jgi:hypothetical protein
VNFRICLVGGSQIIYIITDIFVLIYIAIYTSILIDILMKLTKLPTEEDRHMKIIEYIRSHQGCNVENIVRGTENYVSRVTVYKILGSLEKGGVIRRQKDKPNSRDHKLFVDKDNPLISLPIEFARFKKDYYRLLEKVRKEAKKYLTSSNRSDPETYKYSERLAALGSMFGVFVRIYDTRALLVWPKQIRDPESLKNLYMMLFSEVLEIHSELNKMFQSLFLDMGTLAEEGILANIGVGLLEGVRGTMIHLNNQFENTRMKIDAIRVFLHVTDIWEKDYYSYELKAKSLEKKMDQQFEKFSSKGK